MTETGADEREGIRELSDAEVAALDGKHPRGMTVQEIVHAFAHVGVQLTEATFRKYVQLGLLPRSTRVGRKGKHRGSQGLYPVRVLRQIEGVRRLMSEGFTIEEIQRELLFARAEIDALTTQIDEVFHRLEVYRATHDESPDPLAHRELVEARATAADLIRRLVSVERRLALKTRMARAVV